MPIPQTTNVKPKFKEIGKIRKGIVVMSKGKNPVPRPKEVEYFVMDFNPNAAEAEALFWSKYPKEPTTLRIVAPFDKIEDWWDGWYRCFKGGRMVANAGISYEIAPGLDQNTVYFERLFDVEFSTWVVKKWRVMPDLPEDIKAKWSIAQGQVYLPVDFMANIDPRNGDGLGPVIYTTIDKNNKVKPYYLKVTGTLTVLVRELRTFLGYLSLHTGGKVDVNNISSELAGLKMRADQAGIPLHNLPLVLLRQREGVRDPDGNQTYHYNIHIGLDPEFSQKLAMLQDSQADTYFAGLLGSGQSSGPAELPAVVEVEDDDTYFDTLPEDTILDGDFEDGPAEDDSGDDTISVGTYRDFWTLAEKLLGSNLAAEKDNVHVIWRELQADPAAAVVALQKLAGVK